MLIIGQPDKMLRDVRNIKGSTEQSATSTDSLVSGDNHNASNFVFNLYVRVLGQGRRYSKVTTSVHSQVTLLAGGLSYYFFISLSGI
jgi:hypothetical protein